MNPSQEKEILSLLSAHSLELKEVIQELWSGYGQIQRYSVSGSKLNSIIVKKISLSRPNDHPRGWNTNASHNRKLKSYEVELAWYRKWSKRCGDKCRIADLIYSQKEDDEILLVLEDLDSSGFALRIISPDIEEIKLGLKWLANFHACFLGEAPNGLWREGSYWHLATRADELEKMAGGRLKSNAHLIADKLSKGNFQTFIHGDAKLANFCFSEDRKQIAAVDFQYVGGGCGMKDVAYFLSSCLDEAECEELEKELLDSYFISLRKAFENNPNQIDISALEKEWRSLYSYAWADFTRFLLGWSPDHYKIHSYSRKMVDMVLEELNDK